MWLNRDTCILSQRRAAFTPLRLTEATARWIFQSSHDLER
jgi:hypothetical protein